MNHNHWSDEIEEICEKLRINCVNLSEDHRKRYYTFKSYGKWFRLPLIILASVNSTASVGLQPVLDQQIISGIQQADTHGATALPSRFTTQDIQHFAQDEQVKPNYIPKASGVDMENKRKHENFEDNPEIYEKRIRKKQKERIMDEIQKPLIVAVFIMFSHLPIVARVMYKHFPGLYESQGSLNTGGLLFIALLFSAFYYVFVKVTEYLAE